MKFSLFVVVMFFASLGISQEIKINYKFGKVSKGELEMDSCDFYPDADAMMLFSNGKLHFVIDPVKGLSYQLDIHERLKIFTKNGKNYASKKIYFHNGSSRFLADDISKFKAYTFNLVNDKIEKTKLKKEDRFINQANDFGAELSYTMPNVQEESVIDVKYSIVSKSIVYLKTWYFQNVIPIKYSKYSYSIPDFLKYEINAVGNTINYEINRSNNSRRIGKRYQESTQGEFIAKNVKPLEMELFTGSPLSVLSRLEFNLKYLDLQYGLDKDLGSTYPKMNDDLMQDYDFEKRLSKGKFSKNWTIELKGKTKIEKAKLILEKIQKNMSWNRSYSITSNTAGKKAYNNSEGDIADINLTLIAAFRYHDIEAYPVLLMTRSRGLPHPIYPKKWYFNYVIPLVVIDGKEYLCDGTLNIPFGMIRQECINSNGWLVDKVGRWVDLTKDSFKKEAILYNVEIKDNVIINNVSVQFKSYKAYKAFEQHENDVFEDFIRSAFTDWDIEEINYSTSNNRELFKFEMKLLKEIDDPDLIIINPFIYNNLVKNPFESEKRNSNIDFLYKNNKNAVFNLNIPSGYEIELPKNIQISTDDGALKYVYVASNNTEKVSIISRVSYNKAIFSNSEYDLIKSFFDNMITSNKQIIVLKKNKL